MNKLIISSSLEKSLHELVTKLPNNAQEWWVIGSSAMALSGIQIEPEDVDFLGKGQDVRFLLRKFNVLELNKTEPHLLFDSKPYQRIEIKDGLPIEVMGDMKLCCNKVWEALVPKTRIPINFSSGTIFIPTLQEQSEILLQFARLKDLQKHKKIQDFLSSQSRNQ